MRATLVRLAKHRLTHFLAGGALLAALAPTPKDERAVVIDAARIEEGFRAERARRGRDLSAAEKSAVVVSLVDDEVLAREALRRSLGTDDAVVRARLAERMRSAIAPSVSAVDAPRERRRIAVWFVAKDRPNAEGEAEAIAKAVRAEGPEHVRGARPPIPDGATWTEADLARVAGDGVARAAFEAPLGAPTTPLASAWGFYVLVALERLEPAPVAAPEAPSRAIRRWNRRARQHYRIEVRSPAGEPRFDIDDTPKAAGEDVD